MRHGAIPSAWLALSPAKRLDAGFWLAVLAEVDRLKIPHSDLETIGPIVRKMRAPGRRR